MANSSLMKVELDLPSSILSSLRLSPQEFAHDLVVAAAAKWYESGMLSQERAAELAGVSRGEFLVCLSALGVSPFQESLADLKASARW